MKIAILTQALHSNYGGILQNFALQQILRNMGHDPITIDRHIPRSSNPIKDFVKYLLQIIKPSYDISLLTGKQKMQLSRLQQSFIEQNIKHTERLYSQDSFDHYVSSHPMDAYIVGSDQCWRPCYSANIRNYFLDFVNTRSKKISYAASFGVDCWEFSTDVTASVRTLAKQFNAISVREKSAIELCKTHFDVNASWVLDPTMLLGRDGFMRYVEQEFGNSYILNYLLEESAEARALVQKVANLMHISEVRSNIASPIFYRGESVDSHLNISVEKWLSNLYNASFVITDSFHGAVFCILFNVPFVVKLNAIRGNARLESLLEDFGLMDCICRDINCVTIPFFDWSKINSHLAERQDESYSFLINALK